MFSSIAYHLICVIFLQYNLRSCAADIPLPPFLVVYSPGEPEYTDVLVKQVHDNLTLVCELRGDTSPHAYVWNYMPADGIAGVRSIERSVDLMSSSKLTRQDLQLSDSGQYMCSAPPFSVSKYILVQTKGPQCARGAFWCGSRCVLAAYVCDGRHDCVHGEDEDVSMCEAHVCARSDKLNCSSGRCISEAACCRGPSSLCRQPTCCDEHPRYSRLEGYVDVEYPPLFEDRHAPDDYGFIQSTIYTVTACALIFMIAVVLLVSAICKMHMKRAALRSYAHADRATRHHYNLQYAQAHRFPPCYEASRLLEQEGRVVVTSPTHSPIDSPVRQPLQCNPACPPSPPPESPPVAETRAGFGLARLSSIFSSRYRQVPTQCADVEMTNVRSTSLNNSPTRNRTLDNYRSPTYCDLNTAEFIFTNPETGDCGRDLNYMATPVEFFRQRTMRRNTLERVMNQLDRQRLTLQLGRFQFSIPRFGRRNSSEPRPDTPNVAEINIDDVDFVRLNSNDTYTLNGRTIRLLGANFENYPVMPDGSIRPPSYTEAVRYKLYGPPPEYLSREGLNSDRGVDRVDEEARSNVEMPPCYEDLASGGNGNNSSINNVLNSNVVTVADSMNNGEVAANNNNSGDSVLNSSFVNHPNIDGDNIVYSPVSSLNNNSIVGTHNTPVIRNTTVNSTSPDYNDNGNRANSLDGNNVNGRETISSIIDNLPAIDSDVNANDSVTGMGVNNAINNRVICNE